jgi:hypothetical protein
MNSLYLLLLSTAIPLALIAYSAWRERMWMEERSNLVRCLVSNSPLVYPSTANPVAPAPAPERVQKEVRHIRIPVPLGATPLGAARAAVSVTQPPSPAKKE